MDLEIQQNQRQQLLRLERLQLQVSVLQQPLRRLDQIGVHKRNLEQWVWANSSRQLPTLFPLFFGHINICFGCVK